MTSIHQLTQAPTLIAWKRQLRTAIDALNAANPARYECLQVIASLEEELEATQRDIRAERLAREKKK